MSILRIVVNFAGEGEIPGAININTLVLARRTVEVIRRNGPLIEADIRHVPLRPECADEVVGNYLPFLDRDEWAGTVCREAYRILKPGGSVKFNSHTGGGRYWLDWLAKAGFDNVRLQNQFAIGDKR